MSFNQPPPYFPHFLIPINHHSTLCFYEWLSFTTIPYVNNLLFSISVQFVSFSIMPSRFIHVVANARFPYSEKLNDIPFCVCVYVCVCVRVCVCVCMCVCIFLIHSLVDQLWLFPNFGYCE